MNIMQASRLGQAGDEIITLLKDICLTVNCQQDDIFDEEDREEAKADYVNDCVDMIMEQLTKLKEA